MKKLVLLAASAVVSFGASAQYAEKTLVQTPSDKHVVKSPVQNYQLDNAKKRDLNAALSNTANKSTVGGSRWYSYYNLVDLYEGQDMANNSTYLANIWFDKSIKQEFNTGADTVNYISMNHFFDIFRYKLFNDPNVPLNQQTDIAVTAGDAYTVDSINVNAAYIKMQNRPTGIVDTLIFSVAVSTGIYTLGMTAWPQFADLTTGYYTPLQYPEYNGSDTALRARTIYRVDSMNRAAFSDVDSLPTLVRRWKVILTDADRDTINTTNNTITTNSFTFPVMDANGNPSPLNIPAGYHFSMTVTFKSGDTWIPYVDTLSNFHRFMPLTGEAKGQGAKMPYYYYSHDDRNMSGMMFSTDSSSYLPSVIIEGINAITFRNEFHDFAAHVICPTCATLSVDDVTSNVTSTSVYPNPATNEANILFSVAKAGKVNVTVTNTVGQVISTQSVNASADHGNQVTISTANLSTGVYFYTLEANGERSTNRFVVAH